MAPTLPPPPQDEQYGGDHAERPTNEITYRASILTGVRIVDCDLQAFTIDNCELDNVTFQLCNFSNVTFAHVRLKDVTFKNLNFRNIKFQGVVWAGILWKQEGLANALLTSRSFHEAKKDRVLLPLRTRHTTARSRTTILAPPLVSEGTLDQESNARKQVVRTEAKDLTLLSLPDKVLNRIMEKLFPRPHGRDSMVMMSDIPARGTALDAEHHRQTCYTHQSPFGYRSALFTYHGWPCPSVSRPDDDSQDVFRLKFSTAFLLASKGCYDLAIPHIYDRRFHFDKPESCLAFLHDHQSEEHEELALFVQYSSQTNPTAWRHLFDTLVSKPYVLNELTVEISAEFWDTSVWRQQYPPEAVMLWKGWMNMWRLSDPLDTERGLLEHVVRIPGSRLTSKKRAPTKAEDVEGFLQIQGTKGHPFREAFVDELQMLMRQKMLAISGSGGRTRKGCCDEKRLEESCYWK